MKIKHRIIDEYAFLNQREIVEILVSLIDLVELKIHFTLLLYAIVHPLIWPLSPKVTSLIRPDLKYC
jgi:hypothetical protein